MSEGIESLKTLILCVAAAMTDGADILADKKISFDDYKSIWDLLGQVNKAAPLVGLIPAELSDLDEAEMHEIVAAVQEKFKSDYDKATKIASSAMKTLFYAYDTFKEARG